MGMFDSLYDERGHDWQTKAFKRNLDCYSIGDSIPCEWGIDTFQVEVLGDPEGAFVHSLATVRDGALTSVNDERDPSLPLLDYYGGGYTAPEGI